MRAIRRITAAGPEIVELPTPRPGPGEILLQVRAAGMNAADLDAEPGERHNGILGTECAGVVQAVGEYTPRNWLNQRVMGLTAGGAFAECAVIHERCVMELPEGVSFAQAAAIPHDFTLALEALQEVAQLAPRERLLVIGADSSLGSAVASLGWCLGADVSALLAESAPGEDALSSELRALNPSHAVEWLRHTTVGPEGDLDPHFAARRFDVVVDLCDQLRREALLGLLARGGRWLISSSSKGDISLPSKRWAEHEQQLLGVAPPISDALRRIALIQRARRTILPRLSDGQLRPWLDSNHGFYEAHHARARALRTTPHGKVILSTD